MPVKKRGKKKGEAKAARLEAERLAQEAEFEARKRKESEEREKERQLKARLDELAEREQTLRADELLVKERARKLDEEVSSRANRQVKEAEAREASAEKRMKLREAEIAQAEARYAQAEGELQMRLVEVRAREAALGDGVVGGIAERLEKMLEEQMDVRDVALSRTKQIEAARAELEAKEAALMESIVQKEAALARAEETAAGRIADKERKLTQQDFTLKRRLGRRIKEAEALCEAHRAECAVRDRRFKAREEEIRRRSRELQLLLRKVRKMEAENQRPAQPNVAALGHAAPPEHHPHNQGNPPQLEAGYAYPPEEGMPMPPRLLRPASAPPSRPQPPAQQRPESDAPEPLVDVSSAYKRAPTSATPPRAQYRPSTAGAGAYRPQTAPGAEEAYYAAVDGSPKNDVERARDAQAEQATLATSEQFKALIRHVHSMEDDLVDELKQYQLPDAEPPEADVKTAIRDLNAAERLVCAEGLAQQPPPPQARPFAARHLPPAAAQAQAQPQYTTVVTETYTTTETTEGWPEASAGAPVPAPFRVTEQQ